MKYTKNSDPNFYYFHQTNCGSFALSIKEWYSPDETLEEEKGNLDDYLYLLDDECCGDIYEVSDRFAADLVEIILNDFANTITYLGSDIIVEEVEELIAFRAFAVDGWWDFHFKVYRDGRWQEKNGGDPVHDCDPDEWTYGPLDYISRTFYFLPSEQVKI